MTKKTQAAYQKVLDTLNSEAIKLSRDDYKEFLEELSGHIEILELAVKEEERE